LFAAFLNGNNKQRFFVELVLRENWFLNEHQMPWAVYIGCNQGHSTGVVEASEVAHKLTATEMYSLGLIFHVTDSRFENSIYSKGLVRKNRDSLHCMRMMVATSAREQEPRLQDTVTPQFIVS